LRWDKLLRVRKEPKEELKARYENSWRIIKNNQ
jgi:hypothetical protein